jgi:addiction module HigA family antidote
VKAIHPGRLLKRELQARNLSANKFATALRVPSGRVIQILNGQRGISAESALRFGRYFGNNPQFWMNLQTRYELAVAEQKLGEKIRSEVGHAA